MAQKDIEVILLRQLASYLAAPIYIVDSEGNLVFYNEPAEKLLGRRFEETGEMPAAEWGTIYKPTDDEGNVFEPERLPLMIAVTERRPAHAHYWMRGLDGVRRRISVTAIPLVGQAGKFLGAVAFGWETDEQ
ncbi:MAG: PAS domain-containing protein [Candidatus Binatia bacterium]